MGNTNDYTYLIAFTQQMLAAFHVCHRDADVKPPETCIGQSPCRYTQNQAIIAGIVLDAMRWTQNFNANSAERHVCATSKRSA